jgi:replication-associated recombination protein RarA
MFVDTERKYSPKTLNEFVYANKHVKQAVDYYASGEATRPLILSGTNGTGKSLLATLIPIAIDGNDVEVTKVSGELLNSSKEVRNTFFSNKQFDKFFKNNEHYNYTIIEELNIDSKARDALKIALDETRGTDLAIITTNNIMGIDIGIRSRCEVLEVPACTPEVFLPHAKHILQSEGVSLDDALLYDALEAAYEERADNRKYYQKLDELFRKMN